MLCGCCASASESSRCDSCRYATGWHYCRSSGCGQGDLAWKAGTLHAGHLDIQRVLFNLHRRRLPTEVLDDKAAEYVEKHGDLVTAGQAKAIMDVIKAERGEIGIANDAAFCNDGDAAAAERSGLSRRLSREEMEALLAERIEQMKSGGTEDHPTDQYRVFSYLVGELEHGSRPLRLMIQASAGTGKSSTAAVPRARASLATRQFKKRLETLLALLVAFSGAAALPVMWRVCARHGNAAAAASCLRACSCGAS